MKQYLITAMVLAVTAIAGFTMPSMLLEWQDEQRLENSEIQAAEEVLLTSQTNMTLIEKIQLMQNDMVTTIEMKEGKNYTADGMIVNVQQELKTLSELGILELEQSDLNYGVEGIHFWVDIEGGARSVLLWTVYAGSWDGDLWMVVDDETGKILTFTYTSEKAIAADGQIAVPEELQANDVNLETVAQKWAEYLHIDLVETSVYGQTIVSGYDEMEKEVEALVKKGIDKEEATKKIYEEWGIEYGDEKFQKRRLYATYEDASGMVVFMFRKNTGAIIFMTDIYM